MRISRRTSGGRGEYELSGVLENGEGVAHVIGKAITIEFPESLVIHTRIEGVFQGGKPRLRLRGADIHVQRQLTAAFLMPDSVRENAAMRDGEPVLRRDGYAVEHINFDSLRHVNETAVVATVSEIEVRNQSYLAEPIDLCTRAQMLKEVWSRRDEFPAEISDLLAEHQALVASGSIEHRSEYLVREIQRTVAERSSDLGLIYSESADVLPKLCESLRYQVPKPLIEIDRINPEDIPLKRRAVREWKRWANARGPASAKFRQQVRNAYNSTCLVCGGHYPKTSCTSNPGVNAAYILPWSEYELDEIFNGVCLCKIHHWAFDEGILTIRFNGNDYVTELASDLEHGILESAPAFSLDRLKADLGVIPVQRLPATSGDWPHPQLLSMLSEAY